MVTAVGAVAVALVAGFGTALWQAREASLQRDAAVLAGQKEAQQRAEAELQRTRADERAIAAETAEKAAQAARDAEKQRADQLKKVSDFQARMLGQIDTAKAGVELMADVRERFAAALQRAGVPDTERSARADTLRRELVLVNATDAAAAMIDRTILRPANKTIDEQFKDDPTTDASLRQALADLYTSIGLYDSAYPLQESALATRRRVLGEEHPDTLTSINNMGALLRAQGKLDQAAPYLREAIEKSRRVLGEEHRDTLASINNMGSLLQAQGKLDQAEPYWREALEKYRRVLGEEHPDTVSYISNMGCLLQARGKLDQAEPYVREALEKSRRVLGEEHPKTRHLHPQRRGCLALVPRQARSGRAVLARGAGEAPPSVGGGAPQHTRLHEQRRPAPGPGQARSSRAVLSRGDGECRCRVLGEHLSTIHPLTPWAALLCPKASSIRPSCTARALEKRRRVLAREHPDTLDSINNMGVLLRPRASPTSRAVLSRALEKRRRVLGRTPWSTIASINTMGMQLSSQGKFDQAEPYCREALEKRRRVLGQEHPSTILSINTMSVLLQTQGKLDQAEPYLREALETRRRALGEEHPDTLESIYNMGALLQAQGKLDQAEPYLRDALEKRRSVLGQEHPSTITSINSMGALLRDQGKLDQAEPYCHEALEKRRRVLGEEHAYTLVSIGNMGGLLLAQGKHQDAIDLLRPVEPAARKAFTGGSAGRLADFLTTLGRTRVGLGYDAERFALAEANLLDAHPIYVAAKDRGPTHKNTRECVTGLVDLYTAWDKAEPGKGYGAKAAEWKERLRQAQEASNGAASTPATTPTK